MYGRTYVCFCWEQHGEEAGNRMGGVTLEEVCAVREMKITRKMQFTRSLIK